MSKIAPSAADAAADKSVQDHPLLLLARRCEREEPSRELDAAIYCARYTGAYPDESPERRHGRAVIVADAYTTSLDAAVTLEVAGFFVTVVAGKGQPCAVAWLDVESGVQFNAEAETEPMARCAAALRARAAMENAR